ncbi:hypothetical protein RA2_00628 [Roseovarius sp. A-2]|uniref:hypothetical protein n=1 Tax=Roseovarius sp. A-2 TaxID=1570360 RepID=UPI0009D0F32F|nr:hypothetical protein [Roseovarius sp. A-2]GAW33588.1 hypothetical protein RA2_00628 [Roseovarius sp. A-2]
MGRLRAGKPFLVSGDGRLTACEPVSDDNLARYMLGCPGDPLLWNRVLPIGGPGTVITQFEQGGMLFRALEMTPNFRHVPLRLMDGIVAGLIFGGG